MVTIQEIRDKMNVLIRTEYEQLTADLLLNDFQKQLFRLKYIDKMATDDIINCLHISRTKVNNELFILRRKLAKLPIFNKDKFDVTTASELQIKDRCKKLAKSTDYINFVLDAFYHKLPNKVIAEKYCLTIQTVKIYKNKRKKELSA